MSAFETETLAESDVAAGFSSGVHALDNFLRRHALENDRRGIGRTFVLRGSASTPPAILGFYTLSMATVESDVLPKDPKGRLPRYPIPVALIGRLAVATNAQGQGVGTRLLVDAFRRLIAVSSQVGFYGVIVDAKDARASQFYGRFGFVNVAVGTEFPMRMFLPFDTVLQAAGG